VARPSDALIQLPQPLCSDGETSAPSPIVMAALTTASGPHGYDAARKINGRKGHALVLQLRSYGAIAVVRSGGIGLMLSSPSRPCPHEIDGRNNFGQKKRQDVTDLRDARQASDDPAQAARDAGLLSFGLLDAAWRS
jgi:hypothetical protein